MTQTMNSKSQSNELFTAYIDFEKHKPNESIKSYESSLSVAYYQFVNSDAYSLEGSAASDFIKNFIEKAIDFTKHIVKVIIQIVFNVMNFFRKLIISAMDVSAIRNYSEYYETHKGSIFECYKKYASKTFVTAIPPKNINSFGSNNKFVLAFQQTINLLEEIDRAFKKRIDIWEQHTRHKYSDDTFEQLLGIVNTPVTHITDLVLLGYLGIKLPYDLKPISLYDPQVKDFIINMVKEKLSSSSNTAQILGVILAMPKMVMNTYLFGKPEVKPDIIPVSAFLQMTGPKEFDKLLYNDMSNIKSSFLTIESLVKKMEVISKRLEKSGDGFCDSLKKNSSLLVNYVVGGTTDNNTKTKETIDFIQKFILPLLSAVNLFYSYFSSLIINYSMYYCRHRKSLYEAATMLLQAEKNEQDKEA